MSDPNWPSTTVRVVTGDGAAARDAAAIAAGTSSKSLMQAAGNAAAEVLLERLEEELAGGVLVLTGPGNNGGDGWIVAGCLAGRGISVRVQEVVESRGDDAIAARNANIAAVSLGYGGTAPAVIVDALLGTGARGAPTGALADAVRQVVERRNAGALVVALDIPTGVDATHGASTLAVIADLTIAFGTLKRGHLLSRAHCGTIVVVDIGLGPHAGGDDDAPDLVDEHWVARFLPVIEADAHKGNRRRVLIAGGARGMAGAVILAGRAATRSGVGLVRALVAEPSLVPVQANAIEATAATWPIPVADLSALVQDCHAVLIGPGLGRSDESRQLLEDLLDVWKGPTVMDADAINLFEGDVGRLSTALAGRPALLTPHVREFARLTGMSDEEVTLNRFDIARDTAHALGASILLKGVPTVITGPHGASMVSATGTPVLATAGSGDVLAGVAVTLLAQTGDAFGSGAAAAWVHGRAGEIANTGRPVRGVTLVDVLDAMSHAWRRSIAFPDAPVLAELSAVVERRTEVRR